MGRSRLVAAMFGVAGLVACASPLRDAPIFRAAYWCPGAGSQCSVPVTVDVTGSTCKLRFLNPSQHELTMPSGVQRVPLRWSLDEPSQRRYEFRRDAFSLKSGSTDQLEPGNPIMNGQAFQLVNRHTNTARYEYDLVVHSRDGSAPTPCSVDPFINNVN